MNSPQTIPDRRQLVPSRFQTLRLARCVCAQAVWIATVAIACAQQEALDWHPFEFPLQSLTPVSDPYTAESVQVEWRDETGARTSSLGFSDDGLHYTIRTALPAGMWTWQVVRAPASSGLLHRRGSMQVRTQPEGNPLYRHGWLRVSQKGRYLEHADGTPFLWLGDTAWNSPWLATAEDWDTYLLKRAQQGFSVVLLHCTNSKNITDLTNSAGLRPFENGRPVPAFWDAFDARVAQVNRRGLLALVVGVGLSSSKEYQEESSSPAFARYLAARLGGAAVVFSPSMDIGYEAANDKMGRTLKAASPRHLVTQHVGTDLQAALAYADKDYIDFASLQSGHANGNIPATRSHVFEWTPLVRERAGKKPVSNLEAMYQEFGDPNASTRRRVDARQLAYLTLLSGSYGTTYGASGIWRWTSEGQADSWKDALAWESGEDMARVRAFLGELPWWTLEPRTEAIIGNPAEPEARQALAAAADGSLTVAWMPCGGSITISRDVLPSDPLGVWFDPFTGRRVPAGQPEATDGGWRFSAPAELQEAVLTVRPDSAFAKDLKDVFHAQEKHLTRKVVPSARLDRTRLKLSCDAYTGDEATTQPKEDRNDGVNGDEPGFRRNNVGRAHSGKGLTYWYTSKYQQPGEAAPGREQWVDYVPDLREMGPGTYRLELDCRVSDARAKYPLHCIVQHRDGMALIEVNQREQDDAVVARELGEFELKHGSFVRLIDDGPESVVFGPLKLTRVRSAGTQAKQPAPVGWFESFDAVPNATALEDRWPLKVWHHDCPGRPALRIPGLGGEGAALHFTPGTACGITLPVEVARASRVRVTCDIQPLSLNRSVTLVLNSDPGGASSGGLARLATGKRSSGYWDITDGTTETYVSITSLQLKPTRVELLVDFGRGTVAASIDGAPAGRNFALIPQEDARLRSFIIFCAQGCGEAIVDNVSVVPAE